MMQLLIIGIAFAIIGFCTLLFRKQKKAAGSFPLIIGFGAIYLTTTGPLSKSQEQINKILDLNKDQVAKFTIKPAKRSGYDDISLTQNIIEITDRNAIDSLCSSLTKAKEANAIIQTPKWVCLIRIDKTDRSFLEFEVKNGGRVTSIELKSNGHKGWVYGMLEANSFGQPLLSLIR